MKFYPLNVMIIFMIPRNSPPKIFSWVQVVIIVALLAGCAGPRYIVTVNSISSENASQKKKYILLPGLKTVTIDDLQFKEFASFVIRALTSKGYSLVSNIDNAEIVIFLGYGIGEPKEHLYTYSVPIWGVTGVSSSTTYGTANTYGNISSYGDYSNLSATTFYSGTTTYTPTYGITGSTTQLGSFITYTRYIFLDAYDLELLRKSNELKHLWKTDIVSIGSSGDLRRVFPVLIAASVPYLGENTGQKIQVSLHEDSKQVREIKGIYLKHK